MSKRTDKGHKSHPWLWMFTVGIAVVAFCQGAIFVGAIMTILALAALTR